MERFEPSVDASERSEVLAALSAVNSLLADELSRKSVLAVRVERPRPVALNTTPEMLRVDLPVSLNTSFSVSPLSRLTPLKEESCAVVLICASTLLYCATSAERWACEFGSATAAPAAAMLWKAALLV